MAYRAAICDDCAADAQFVSEILKAWADERGAEVNAEIYPSAESFLFAYDENKAYDMLLLDIEMGGMDGVSMARRVRAGNKTVQIIFITGYSDYIAEGYDVAALHYLMKPVNREKLFGVLDRAVERLKISQRALIWTWVGRWCAYRFMKYAISTLGRITLPCMRSMSIPLSAR